MTVWKRAALWAGAVGTGLVLIGLGVYFFVTGLDRADKLSSAIGVFVSVLGLGVSGYGVLLTRRGPAGQPSQSVTGSTVGGGVVQVRGARGNVRIAPVASAVTVPPPGTASPPPLSSASDRPAVGGQSVAGSEVSGSVRQFDDVGGDLDLDR